MTRASIVDLTATTLRLVTEIRGRTLVGFVVLLTLNSSVHPILAQDVDLELRVQRLVQQLDAEQLSDRDTAEEQLMELGEDVISLLPRVDDSTPAEMAQRLKRIRKTLESAASEQVTTASKITLKGSYTIEEILAAVKEQTGNEVVNFGNQAPTQKLDVEFNETEFWPMLDQVLDMAVQDTYVFTGRMRTLGYRPRGEGAVARSNRAAYSGLFRISPAEVQSSRDLKIPTRASLRLRLEVLWEPRVVPITIRQGYQDLELIGDDGSTIEVSNPQGASQVAVQSTVAGVDIRLPLNLPSRSVKQIDQLRGRMTATLPGREETFEFEDLDLEKRNVTKQQGGVQVTLERVRKNGSVYEFRIRLKLADDGPQFESYLDWASSNTIYLVDSEGKQIDNPNYERYLERDREIGFAYLFPLSGELKDYKLVYKSPASLVNVPVDYTIRNIDLP